MLLFISITVWNMNQASDNDTRFANVPSDKVLTYLIAVINNMHNGEYLTTYQ